jgi:hypothetical protein
MATDPFGKNTFGGMTSLGGIPGVTYGAATTAAPTMPWKSYGEYFKGNPEAANSEEYNQYKTTLPQQYRDLINYGISPEMVASGAVKNIYRGDHLEPIQMPSATPGGASPGVYGAGSGSSNMLAPEVLRKMWR